MSTEDRYNSIYTGTEIDAALGRIISGDIDEAVGKAQTAQAGAEAAQKKAETAQAAAEDARQGAETAQSKAETAQAAAEAARQGAETAQTKADTAQAAAEAAKTAAQQAASDANASAQQAAESAAALSGTIDDVADLKAGLAKNTAADAAAKRSLDALWKLNQGISYQFETDDTEAYSKTVPTGAKCADVQMIGGKTVAWNQLVDKSNFMESSGIFTNNGDGSVTANGTPSALTRFRFNSQFTSLLTVGHKYYFGGISGGSESTYYYRACGGYLIFYNAAIITLSQAAFDDGDTAFSLLVVANAAVNITVRPFVVDLTQLFGTGNEPTSTDDPRIAWIEQYAAAHPEYNAGELVSADVESVDTVGFNRWDEEWANGYYNASAGLFVSVPTALTLACKNKIPVLPSATYYFRFSYGSSLSVFEYDRSGKYLRRSLISGPSKTLITTQETVLIAFHIAEYGNGVYNHDVCINLSDANKNGEYKPYNKTACNIPSAVRALLGYGWSAGDVCNSIERTDKGWQYVQRVGYCDLGTLSFVSYSDAGAQDASGNTVYAYYAKRPTGCIIGTKDSKSNIITEIGEQREASLIAKLTWKNLDYTLSTDGNIWFIFTEQKTTEELNAIFSGKKCYFELATPVITDITDIMTLDFDAIPVEAGGTLTLENSALLAVPNSLEYAVSLAEVNG